MSILTLVPSRGRPERAQAMADSYLATASGEAALIILVDPDDPALEGYRDVRPQPVVMPKPMGYTAALNWGATHGLRAHALSRGIDWGEPDPREADFDVLGAFGDDVLFRTPGWDRIVEQALATPGIAYGDDLIHGKNHPSAVWMSSAIAKALGWLALPATTHQWADDAWKRLGQELGLLRFLPDVVVEHLHPAVGKAEWDPTYASVFEDERAKRDFEGFTHWVDDGGLQSDAAKVRAALEVTA